MMIRMPVKWTTSHNVQYPYPPNLSFSRNISLSFLVSVAGIFFFSSSIQLAHCAPNGSGTTVPHPGSRETATIEPEASVSELTSIPDHSTDLPSTSSSSAPFSLQLSSSSSSSSPDPPFSLPSNPVSSVFSFPTSHDPSSLNEPSTDASKGSSLNPTISPPLVSPLLPQVDRKSYSGYSVLRLTPRSDVQLKFLQSLYEKGTEPEGMMVGSASPSALPTTTPTSSSSSGSLSSGSRTVELDFWTEPVRVNSSVDLMVAPRDMMRLEKSLRRLNIDKHLMIDDVERLIQKEKQSMPDQEDFLSFRGPTSSFFDSYQTLDEVQGYLDSLVFEYPDLVSNFTIGRSYEGRDLRMIKIGSKSWTESRKPSILLDAGIHSREWISISTALFTLQRLTRDYDHDSNIKRIVDTFDIYVLPVANPDGYEWTHIRDRMWRKTRSRHGSVFGCRGVDPNRNFDSEWNVVGASENPCSETYSGPYPFSEPETKSLADFISRHKEELRLYMPLHSYSQLWLTPWGHSRNLPHNYKDMESRAFQAASALHRKHGSHYRVGSAANVLYPASGAADDWAHDEAGIPYVYTVELRDTGKYGFLLPADQIIPTGEEFMEGFKDLVLGLI